MKEKKKCNKCGLLIDEDLERCPYCDSVQNEVIKEKEAINNDKIEKQNENKRGNTLFKFPSRVLKLAIYKQILLIALGLFLIKLISFIVQLIIAAINPTFLTQDGVNMTIEGAGTINFIVYGVLFLLLVLVVFKNNKDIVLDFKGGKKFLINLAYGALMMAFTLIVGNLFRLIGTWCGISVADNNNEMSIDRIVPVFPFLSILIFGIIGPICEEYTYRLGVFSLFYRKNRVLAYFATCLIFGLIHFDFSALASGNGMLIANEFLNLPSYIAAGLALSYIYEKRGISGSITAHCLNNLYSIIMTLILSLIPMGA